MKALEQALVLIDIQKGFDKPVWGESNNPEFEKNISKIISAWRLKNLPIIHIKHDSTNPSSPLYPGSEGNQFKDIALPEHEETVFSKSVNSAFIGTQLEDYLHKHTIKTLIIAGLTTDHCVSTTTRMAANLGFNVTLISDACATFNKKDLDGTIVSADLIHKINLVSLADEFCQIKTTKQLIDDLK